jgi:hypothetical protein
LVSVIVLYEHQPPAERYAEHLDLCRLVPGAELAHGPVIGAATGDPQHAYFAELRFAGKEAFGAAIEGPAFTSVAADAAAMGIPHTVHFADLERL